MNRERTAFGLFLMIILLVMPAYLYCSYVTGPSSAPWSTVGDLKFQATSVQVTGIAPGGLDLSLTAAVHNPNDFGVSLNGANHSIYANGHYLQNGHVTRKYALAPQSTQTFVFPISIAWSSALKTLGNYIWAWGSLTWEVKGVATVEVGGFSIAIPFELSTHTG